MGLLAVGLCACHSGPPKPLDEPADAHVPRWMAVPPPTSDYATATETPQTRPQTVPANGARGGNSNAAPIAQFPREFVAVGQSSESAASVAREEAAADATRNLQTIVMLRIRRALLDYVAARTTWPLDRHHHFNRAIWATNLAPFVPHEAFVVRGVTRDPSGEKPITYAEAAVKFSAVLDAAIRAADAIFADAGSDTPPPDARQLANGLAARASGTADNPR